jgi:hypothetical protein
MTSENSNISVSSKKDPSDLVILHYGLYFPFFKYQLFFVLCSEMSKLLRNILIIVGLGF